MDPQQWQSSYPDAAVGGLSRRNTLMSQQQQQHPQQQHLQQQPPPPPPPQQQQQLLITQQPQQHQQYQQHQQHQHQQLQQHQQSAYNSNKYALGTPQSGHTPQFVPGGGLVGSGAPPHHMQQSPSQQQHLPPNSAMASSPQMSLPLNRSVTLNSQDPSVTAAAVATRYSPLNALSPASPYAPKMAAPPPAATGYGGIADPSLPHHQQQQGQQGHHSPTNQGDWTPHSSPYFRQQPQLPPITPYGSAHDATYSPSLDGSYSADPKSPRRPMPQSATATATATAKGPVPEFKEVRTVTDLRPRVNPQPPFRRANPEGGFISPLQALTMHLPSTYRICNPSFEYKSGRNPRRVLTKPSKGVKNDGYDNEDSDYILYVNDILGSEEAGHKNRYLILDVLGQGTFGQVVKCQNMKTQEVVAVKVIKNRTAYFNQSMMEVSVLDLLNTKLDKNDDHHLLRLKDTFIHRQHLCLVFELLSVNLYELIKQNQFRGLSTTLVRVFAQQLLNGLALLNKARLIHCDLKPENILLKNLESPIIKIIDFGSACDERQTVYTYIQSRFYRSPEVLLGLPYSSAIDMWSLGCIVVELFLGLPLFPGSSEYNQVARIVEMLGNPPNWMLEMGKQANEFFEKRQDEFGRRTYHLKSMEQYSHEHGTKEQPSKKYFAASNLTDIIKSYSMPRKGMKPAEVEREMNNRIAFIDFVKGLLNINPLERWSPQQAKLHPFITQQKFTGPFVPPMNLRASSLNRSPAPGTQQQLHGEAMSKQRAQAAHVQAANGGYATLGGGQFAPQGHSQAPIYANNAVYSPSGAHPNPPPYETGHGPFAMPHAPQQQVPGQQVNPSQYSAMASQASLYQQSRGSRQRASTMEQQRGIPQAMQRVASQLDPNAPIRSQPSPAYYPPPADGGVGGRSQQGPGPRNFIRNLEEHSMGSQNPWH